MTLDFAEAATMIKTLTKHGNSYALIIDRAILELLRIDPETPLELTTNGQSLTVRPVEPVDHETRLQRSLERINDRHGEALKRLAE